LVMSDFGNSHFHAAALQGPQYIETGSFSRPFGPSIVVIRSCLAENVKPLMTSDADSRMFE